MSKNKNVKRAQKKGLHNAKRKVVAKRRERDAEGQAFAAKKHKRSLILRMLDSFKKA